MNSLTPPPYLFTYCVICLHHVTIAIFVYILRHLFTYQRINLGVFTPRDREVIDPAAVFVYILHHLFTYQRITLGLFTPRDLEVIEPAAIFVYILRHLITYQRKKVSFIYTT